jgi:hypothetical protein
LATPTPRQPLLTYPHKFIQNLATKPLFFECAFDITTVTNIAMVKELDSRPQQKAGVGVVKPKRICWEKVMEEIDDGADIVRMTATDSVYQLQIVVDEGEIAATFPVARR